MTLDSATPRSRRAILAAAAGAAAATVVGAIARPSTVAAANGATGDIIHTGDTYSGVTAQTTLGNQANNNTVLWVASNPDGGFGGGIAVVGHSDTSIGVAGWSGVAPFPAGSYGVHGAADTGTGVKGQSNTGIGVVGYSSGGSGVAGQSGAVSGIGVSGTSGTGAGIYGSTNSGRGVHGYASAQGGIGVRGESNASDTPAVVARSLGNSTGVLGFSGSGAVPVAHARTGVYGRASQDTSSKGVWGFSAKGHGVHGESGTGYAGYFDGKIFTTKFHEMQEIPVPAAPTTNKARLFLRDNGSGKTQLCVRFSSGAVQVLSTQP